MDVKTVCLGMLTDGTASGYDLKKEFESTFAHFFAAGYGSIYPAVWSFQLALRSRGLGSTLTTSHLLAEQEVALRLGVPSDYTQVALIPVAHIKGGELSPPQRRPVEEVIGWNGW